MPEKPRKVGSKKARTERVERLTPILARCYPGLSISLSYETPFQLVVATILSAQCTDERVNQVTPELFARYPGPREMASADREEIEGLIHSTGFFRNKAKNIQGAATAVLEEFGGEVPETMDELLRMPGVARKTANVVMANAFDRTEGIVVDTHVKRVAGRLGLTGETDPVKVEQDLMEVVPRDQWRAFPWRLILHGRARCPARSPDCPNCEVAELCPSAGRFH